MMLKPWMNNCYNNCLYQRLATYSIESTGLKREYWLKAFGEIMASEEVQMCGELIAAELNANLEVWTALCTHTRATVHRKAADGWCVEDVTKNMVTRALCC